ncbi:rhodanese-like domain-containing protein [Kitasatospora purpeofusca]|uniref:rhodanese-like domain-containing protein n=1 Tax=Kitasatospora purpeofusca TaxID=67352 RepID=UPI00224D8EE2|nr:rhodanese-like domain-containing protein [Kitasatospora purpeofusca]MCX4757155.1 rhodanese-like domain-containing protein [Kitasatospora purpeofusca]WSR35084.1 rhodanese-like domain-containing protein [Kitasatospora purpeofusca]WSR43407.1 rhodanese-like domain-containing protein [Kitasatospora purpeofusca]
MVREVDVEAFAAARTRGALVLDVREAFEFAAGHVPGARWVPLGMLAGRIAELPRDRTVMVICASGNRSRIGAELLGRAGFDAASVRGGTAEWSLSGRDLAV